MMTNNPTSPGERHAELSDSQLLSRLLDLDTPARTAPLHSESLLDLLWITSPEVRRYFHCSGDKVRAIRNLAENLARAELAREVLADPAALVRFLFFAYSRGDATATGVAFIDGAGGLSAHRDVFDDCDGNAGAAMRETMRVALVLEASILVFHVRADGDCRPSAAERELDVRFRAAAELLEVPVVDSWVVAGPGKWSALSTGTGVPAAPANQILAHRPLTADEMHGAEINLSIFLADSRETVAGRKLGISRAQRLLAEVGGLRGLAATAPDELSCPGLPPPRVARTAAALEIVRRLRQVEVTRPRSESESRAAVLLHRFAGGSGKIQGVIFTGEYGKQTLVPVTSANGSKDAVFLNRWLLSQAAITRATEAQPFTFTAESGEEGAADEGPAFWPGLEEMRPFFDFEIRDHLRVFGDGRWHAGGLSGRLAGHVKAALVTPLVAACSLRGKAGS